MEERAFLMANETGQLKAGLTERQSGDESGGDLGGHSEYWLVGDNWIQVLSG